MLDTVCLGVRQYLQSRADTIRCIVESITDDSNAELREEVIILIALLPISISVFAVLSERPSSLPLLLVPSLLSLISLSFFLCHLFTYLSGSTRSAHTKVSVELRAHFQFRDGSGGGAAVDSDEEDWHPGTGTPADEASANLHKCD